MISKYFKTTSITSAIIALLFTGVFAINNARNTSDGEATFGSCTVGEQTRIFLSDIPAYSTRNDRVLSDPKWRPEYERRQFTLPDITIKPGKYEIRSISSDNHYNHRSTAPEEDKQNQPNEEYYVLIGGQRTPKHSVDFTDFYDWRGADGELLQDDDNNVDTVPSVIRESWVGSSMGIITVTEATNVIEVHHASFYDDFTDRANSVIPSAVVAECKEPVQPVLEIDEVVDANGDGIFGEVEQLENGKIATWKFTGRNVGNIEDKTATMYACAPAGTTLIAGSAKVEAPADDFASTLTEEGNCVRWMGWLLEGVPISIQFDTTVNDFDACDLADGKDDDHCTSTSVVYSTATGTNQGSPADSDEAQIVSPKAVLSIVKRVDGSDAGSVFTDDEQVEVDGSGFVWKITAINNGEGDEDNARVVDNYPAGVKIDKAEASHGTVAVKGSKIVWDGSLKSGQKVEITVDSSIANPAAYVECDGSQVPGNTSGDGRCTNRAFVGQASSNYDDEFEGPTKHDDAEVFAVLSPNLTIKKYVDGVDADSTHSDQTPELIEAGVNFEWRIVGCNTGNAIQSNARIVDTVLNGLNLKDVAAAIRVSGVLNGAVTVEIDPVTSRPVVVWNGDINPGDCVDIRYTTDIVNQDGFNNCVVVSNGAPSICGDDAYIGVSSADNAVAVDPLTRLSDSAYVKAEFSGLLSIEKFIDGNNDDTYNAVSEEVQLDNDFKWKLVGKNSGNGVANNVRIVDVIPGDVSLKSAKADIGVTLNGGAQTTSIEIVQINGTDAVVWDGVLPVDASVEIVFATSITDEASLNGCVTSTPGEQCRNEAVIGTASSESTEVTGQKDNDTADAFANPEGRLVIDKEIDVDGDGSWSELETAEFGEWFEWRIAISNQGKGTVRDVAILDVFPEGVIVGDVVSEPDTGDVEIEAGEKNFRLFWTTERFAPGDTAEIVVRSKIADMDAFTLCDEGIVDGVQDDLCANRAFVGTGVSAEDFKDRDVDTAQFDIVRSTDLYIVKKAEGNDSDDVETDFEHASLEGGEFEWLITFGNKGNTVAEDVVVTDALQEGVNYVSHETEGTDVEATYDATTRTLSWNGDLEPGEEFKITLVSSFDNPEAYAECTGLSDTDGETCMNIAELAHGEEELKDPAAVLGESISLPVLGLEKTVDANNDGNFSKEERVEANGAEATWRINITNSGDGDANDLKLNDIVTEGLSYVTDSLVEIEGGAQGVATFNDGVIVWAGDLPANSKVVLEFRTIVASAAAFVQCNFSDGNANDSKCTNTATLDFAGGGSSTDGIVKDSAALTTSLPQVLAYTGYNRGYTSVIVGAGIVAVTVFLTAGRMYAFGGTSKRGGGNSGAGSTPSSGGGGVPPTMVHPS